MRLAFVGKGGAGKSVLAATLARHLARAGRQVLVVDSDPLPGLARSLGLPTDAVGLPDEAIEETTDAAGRPVHRPRSDLSSSELVDRYAVRAPDGVRVLFHGKMRGIERAGWASQAAVRRLLEELIRHDGAWDVVGDLPGGTRQAFFGWGGYAERYLAVVEPTASSILSARRLARLGRGPGGPSVAAVANKVTDPGDADRVANGTGLEVVAAIPRCPELGRAERHGQAVIDACPGAPAVAAVASLAELLVSQEAS